MQHSSFMDHIIQLEWHEGHEKHKTTLHTYLNASSIKNTKRIVEAITLMLQMLGLIIMEYNCVA